MEHSDASETLEQPIRSAGTAGYQSRPAEVDFDDAIAECYIRGGRIVLDGREVPTLDQVLRLALSLGPDQLKPLAEQAEQQLERHKIHVSVRDHFNRALHLWRIPHAADVRVGLN